MRLPLGEDLAGVLNPIIHPPVTQNSIGEFCVTGGCILFNNKTARPLRHPNGDREAGALRDRFHQFNPEKQ
ncbi:hypothetical protein [Fortiea contorta]|uniref:hypothetical protein n=1 Tax=Fortiea contorta TaxID=1892405 RepID=UPI00036EB187|nr:hypothetical protein [Fortiea contorta]